VIAGLIARVRSLWHSITRGHAIDAEMRAEFEHHMELHAADLVKSGVPAEEARRRARAEFGGMYNYKEAGREARGLRWLDAFRISWLDIKLGIRMTRRYPGLTLIGGLAMGVAIALGAAVLTVIALMENPRIPLDEGDKIVGIQVWSIMSNNAERRIAHDLGLWKSELHTVQDVGAFRNVMRAVGAGDGRAEPGRGAEISAAGFRVARVRPLLGRYLLDDDERAGAPPVVVLGYEIWSRRFGADSSLVGKAVKIGGVGHMVVGVMPPGFAFPVNHNLWLPLQLGPLAIKPRQGPVLYAFGRVAPGFTLAQATAEVAAIGERTGAQLPETHQRLRPRLLPFAQSWFELDSPETVLVFRAAQVAVTLLLVIICVNIATLVYARTATRQAEIAVRSALGASRGRIVAQLVGEALALAGVGAAVGLTLLAVLAARMDAILLQTGAQSVVPFWLRTGVSTATVAYVIALAVLASLIIGIVPALRVTGRRVQASLQRLAGGHASVRMGNVWTSLIVVEVAFTVAILPTAVFFASESLKAMMTGPGFRAEQYLSAELAVNRESTEGMPGAGDSAYQARSTLLRDEVIRRLRSEGGVRAVTWSAELPGSEQSVQIELDGAPARLETRAGEGTRWSRWVENARRVRLASVEAGFFDAFDVAPLVGRTFTAADAGPHANVALVNRTFADSLLGGGNPIGRRLRMLGIDLQGEAMRGPWQEIVGVVPNVPAHVDYERPQAVWHSPTRRVQPARLAIHVPGTDPAGFAPRLRAITADVDASLFLRSVQPLSEALWATHLPLRLIAAALAAVATSVLVLSAASLYALMSVIVTQRRREIGIRIALGADRRRVLAAIFSRAALQVGGGVALGIMTAGVVLRFTGGEMRGFNALLVLPAVALFMVAVGVLAALGPARRGLAIQPSAVLKEE
jgi:predicted permease